jgi:hypothetical protein
MKSMVPGAAVHPCEVWARVLDARGRGTMMIVRRGRYARRITADDRGRDGTSCFGFATEKLPWISVTSVP